MLRLSHLSLLVLLCAGLTRVAAAAAPLQALWRERVHAVVAVEFYVETETERRPTITGGLVLDREGTVALAGNSVPTYLPPNQLKDFRVYLPGNPSTEFARADYLGHDPVTGWHYLRIAAPVPPELRPITDFVVTGAAEPGVTDEVWGIALRSKDEDFEPYFLTGRIGLLATLPQRSAIALGRVAAPQLPVFDRDGAFAGVGMPGYGESFYQYSRTERGTPLLLVSGDEARVFRLASEVLPYLHRVPKNPFGRPSAWLGVMGVQPVQAEVAKYLKLDGQSALVVSEVLEGGPAEAAGMKDRDIILAVAGKPLPRLRPPQVAPAWLEREVALRAPGDVLPLTVLRGTERIELSARLADEPKMLREAERKFFDRLGFTVREFLFIDVVANRIKSAERTGVVTHFVKPNSPAAAAGLRGEDWIREIDGMPVATFAEAVQKLTALENDLARTEFVLLVSRNGETSVLRVKLR